MRTHLVLSVVDTPSGYRYEVIGKDLVIFHMTQEPNIQWFDATTIEIAKGNNISPTEAFRIGRNSGTTKL